MAVDEHEIEGEAHAERVDRAAARQQEPYADRQLGEQREPEQASAGGAGDQDPQTTAKLLLLEAR